MPVATPPAQHSLASNHQLASALQALTSRDELPDTEQRNSLLDALGTEIHQRWKTHTQNTALISLGDIYMLMLDRIKWLAQKSCPWTALARLVKYMEHDARVCQATHGLIRTYSALPQQQDYPHFIPLDNVWALPQDEDDTPTELSLRSARALESFYSILHDWGISQELVRAGIEAIANVCVASSRRGPNARRSILLTMLHEGKLPITGRDSAVISWLYLVAGRRAQYEESLLWTVLEGQELDPAILSPTARTKISKHSTVDALRLHWLREVSAHAQAGTFYLQAAPI